MLQKVLRILLRLYRWNLAFQIFDALVRIPLPLLMGLTGQDTPSQMPQLPGFGFGSPISWETEYSLAAGGNCGFTYNAVSRGAHRSLAGKPSSSSRCCYRSTR